MLLGVSDTKDFNISMKLDIDFDLEYMGIVVRTWDKNEGTTQTKCFPPQDFSEALDYYRQQQFLFKSRSVTEM